MRRHHLLHIAIALLKALTVPPETQSVRPPCASSQPSAALPSRGRGDARIPSAPERAFCATDACSQNSSASMAVSGKLSTVIVDNVNPRFKVGVDVAAATLFLSLSLSPSLSLSRRTFHGAAHLRCL